MNVNDFFDKVYVISISTALDRREKISNHLNQHNINFEFFDAYEITRSQKYLISLGLFTREYQVKPHKWWARFGCFLSHQMVLKKAMDEGLEKVLILEDDVFFKDDFFSHFPIYVNELPTNWPIVMFGYYVFGFTNKHNVSFKISEHIYTLTEVHGAHAIGYNLKSNEFKKYYDDLQSSLKFDYHYDWYLNDTTNNLLINRYGVYPQFTGQEDNQYSFIMDSVRHISNNETDIKYDLLKSGTVYPMDSIKFVKHFEFKENQKYILLIRGRECKITYKNGGFVDSNGSNIINPTYVKIS